MSDIAMRLQAAQFVVRQRELLLDEAIWARDALIREAVDAEKMVPYRVQKVTGLSQGAVRKSLERTACAPSPGDIE